MDFSGAPAYFNLNQNEFKDLGGRLNELTEPVNFSYISPSLIHLGFDEAVTRDISRHQFDLREQSSSVFAEHYFHFEIAAPITDDRYPGFLAVMDSEQHFLQKKAVTGGFLYGKPGKGTLLMHIYGLKNGTYAMLSFIDENKNRELDFDKTGKALEKYATFSDHVFSGKQDVRFSNTSASFNRENAKVTIEWKE